MAGDDEANDGASALSAMESPGLFEAYMEAEARYRTTTGAEQQHWFDRRVEIAAALNARFGWWPEPKRSAEDPAARPFQIPDRARLRSRP